MKPADNMRLNAADVKETQQIPDQHDLDGVIVASLDFANPALPNTFTLCIGDREILATA